MSSLGGQSQLEVNAVDSHGVRETPSEIEDKQTDKREPLFVRLRNTLCRRFVLKAVALGQTLSLCICGTAVTSGLLQRQGISIPTAQSFTNYLLLGLVYGTMLACQPKETNIVAVLKDRWWKYILLALVDVEANYLVVKAYQYTTVTSVQLLDCITIPTVLVLSWVFLRMRYKFIHFAGVGLCLLGVGSLILADVLVERYSSNATNKLLGDFLCVGGAILYGVSNVGQEFVVRAFNRVEFLGMIGIFGTIINGIQFIVLERHEVAQVDFTSYKIVLPLLGFALCLFLLYSLMPVVIRLTSATSVNLNLLSSDFYALLFSLFLFKDKFHVLYFMSFSCVIVGVFVFTIQTPHRLPVDNTEETPPAEPEVNCGDNSICLDSICTTKCATENSDTEPLTVTVAKETTSEPPENVRLLISSN